MTMSLTPRAFQRRGARVNPVVKQKGGRAEARPPRTESRLGQNKYESSPPHVRGSPGKFTRKPNVDTVPVDQLM